MELSIRPAGEGDLEWIVAKEADPHFSPFIWSNSVEEHRKQLTDPQVDLMIYQVAGAPAGFLLGLMGNYRVYELRRLALARDYQGRGLGEAALILALKRAFEERDAHRLWLDVYEYNQRAIALYRKYLIHEGILRHSDKRGDKYANQWIFSILEDEYRRLF
ncbi:MAG: GNAT family N-acetyltransferase [Tissierellia bacterium]|nr:GNAT family N-acetyltransferase [Tissierellia bacterium]